MTTPATARIVAYITALGYLYCVPCSERLEISGTPVYHDNAAHNQEPCDSCQEVSDHA